MVSDHESRAEKIMNKNVRKKEGWLSVDVRIEMRCQRGYCASPYRSAALKNGFLHDMERKWDLGSRGQMILHTCNEHFFHSDKLDTRNFRLLDSFPRFFKSKFAWEIFQHAQFNFVLAQSFKTEWKFSFQKVPLETCIWQRKKRLDFGYGNDYRFS